MNKIILSPLMLLYIFSINTSLAGECNLTNFVLEVDEGIVDIALPPHFYIDDLKILPKYKTKYKWKFEESIPNGRHRLKIKMNPIVTLGMIDVMDDYSFLIKNCEKYKFKCKKISFLVNDGRNMAIQCDGEEIESKSSIDITNLNKGQKFLTVQEVMVNVDAGVHEKWEREVTFTREVYIEKKTSVTYSGGLSLPTIQATIGKNLERMTGKKFGETTSTSQGIMLDGNICNKYKILIQKHVKSGTATINHTDILPFSYDEGIRISAKNLCKKITVQSETEEPEHNQGERFTYTDGYSTLIKKSNNFTKNSKGKLDPSYCESYAAVAVEQHRRSEATGCMLKDKESNETKSRWSYSAEPQSKWCLDAWVWVSKKEAIYRENRIKECLSLNQ